MNSDGVALRSTFTNDQTLHYLALVTGFVPKVLLHLYKNIIIPIYLSHRIIDRFPQILKWKKDKTVLLASKY